MYQRAYGIIETQAPLHVGASAGEETGNLNLIFRDQFIHTGIIPGSSLRGRFRADMRQENPDKVDHWYGQQAVPNEPNSTSEAIVKFEYASIVWLPVYCPNQPIVYVSCPALLKRYQKITGKGEGEIKPYTYYGESSGDKLFFNLGFLPLESKDESLGHYVPEEIFQTNQSLFFVVDDQDMGMIHDMALYRQSRVALSDKEKKATTGAFFDVEALPEETVMIFPLAMRKAIREEKTWEWEDFLMDGNFALDEEESKELYFGGLESIGFGRTTVSLHKQSSESSKVKKKGQPLEEKESKKSQKQKPSKWKPYELDHRAQMLVLNHRDQKDVLNESHKMRITVAYGLERFWGEHLRLKKENRSQAKSAYWENVWKELASILQQGNIQLPQESIDHNDSTQIKEEVQKIWALNLEQTRIALMILTQFCDSLVWWTQRYKTKEQN